MSKIVICKSHITCGNGGCVHKKEHEHYGNCDELCFNDDIDGMTCIAAIKVSRKEKIQKIEENNFLSELD